MHNIFVRLFGWTALIFQQVDVCVYDRWRWLQRHLVRPSQRTLDAGCGAGEFTLYSAQLGNPSLGLSFDDRLNEIGRERARILHLDNVEFLTEDLRNLDQFAGRLGLFDQIICLETIEHILNDRKLICDLTYLLKPNGRLLLTTPFKGKQPLIADSVSMCEDGGHVRCGYTYAEIQKLLTEDGLEIVRVDFVSGLISQQLANWTQILARINSRLAWGVVLPFRVFQLLDTPLTNLIHYPYLSIAVIGIKRG